MGRVVTGMGVVGVLLCASSTAFACTMVEPLPSVSQVVARADAIVIGIARELIPRPIVNSFPVAGDVGGEIVFEVAEILKGDVAAPTVTFTGVFTDNDDFNDTPVTKNWPRPEARGGPCFAYTYRQGASYLLFLKRTPEGTLSPYWYGLSRVNDQIRAYDPWLAWVRQRLASQRRRR